MFQSVIQSNHITNDLELSKFEVHKSPYTGVVLFCFYLRVDSWVHKTFMHLCLPQSVQDWIKGDWSRDCASCPLSIWGGPLMPSVAPQGPGTGQGFRPLCVPIGGSVEHWGVSGQKTGLKWRKVPNRQRRHNAGARCPSCPHLLGLSCTQRAFQTIPGWPWGSVPPYRDTLYSGLPKAGILMCSHSCQ